MGDDPVAQQPPGGHEGGHRDPIETQPAGGDAERIADHRQPREEHQRAAVALELFEDARIEPFLLAIRQDAADRKQKRFDPRILEKLKRYGSPLMFFAWLPVVGDALCIAAGWLRLNWIAVTAFMAAGRLLRYWVVAQGALL